MKRFAAVLTGLMLFLFWSCSPGIPVPKSTITIAITGNTMNNVNFSWVIHDDSGTGTVRLNHDSENPWSTMSTGFPFDEYGDVSISIQNSAGNIVLSSGDGTSVTGSSGSDKTIELTNLTVPENLSTISVGDILEDNSVNLLHIINVQNTTVPHYVVVKDSDNNFDAGNWRILSDNSAYFTVWVERDGVVIGSPRIYSTLINNVSFTYGSIAW